MTTSFSKSQRPRPSRSHYRELTKEAVLEEIMLIKSQEKGEEQLAKYYQNILDTRKFEIENFWKRTGYFWGAMAGVVLGYFGLLKGEIQHFAIFVSILGLFYNIVFSLSLRGSKYWQEHWERVAVIYEEAIGFRIFSWHLRETLASVGTKEGWFKARRFSVSKLTMVLGDFTIIFWVGLVAKDIKWLLTSDQEGRFYLFYDDTTRFSWFALFLWIYAIAGFLLIIYFIFKSYRKYVCRPEEEFQFLGYIIAKRLIQKIVNKYQTLGKQFEFNFWNYFKVKFGINYFIKTNQRIYLLKRLEKDKYNVEIENKGEMFKPLAMEQGKSRIVNGVRIDCKVLNGKEFLSFSLEKQNDSRMDVEEEIFLLREFFASFE